ncbi:MAG TPA: YciI family protein [Pseudolysinimonas sp.]|nr:YciI family protein [Pseudolysinimonas sp.]
MEFLLLICTDSTAPEHRAEEDNIEEWWDEVVRRGMSLAGDRLRPPVDATTVRVRNGAVSVTDGPFVETKDYIAGFDLLTCADLDDAIDIASRHPMARFGQIEIRPVWPLGLEVPAGEAAQDAAEPAKG